jgi:hypothetical protein
MKRNGETIGTPVRNPMIYLPILIMYIEMTGKVWEIGLVLEG